MLSQSAIEAQLKTPLSTEEIKKLEKHMKGKSVKKQKYLDEFLAKEIAGGNFEMSQLLMRAGAKVNPEFEKDLNIHLRYSIVVTQNVESLRCLLLVDAKVIHRYRNASGGCIGDVISMHAEPTIIAMLTVLLDVGANLNILYGSGYSPFYWASYRLRNNPTLSNEVAKLLINGGLDIKQLSKSDTALHTACRWQTEEIVQLLLDKGADLNVFGIDGRSTPFYEAFGNQKLSDTFLLKLIPLIKEIDQRCGQCRVTYLLQACDGKKIPVIKALLEKGAHPKNISQEDYEKFDNEIKKILAAKLDFYNQEEKANNKAILQEKEEKMRVWLQETTAKIVSRLMRNIRDERKLKKCTPECLILLKECIEKALGKPGLIDDLIDATDPQIIQLRVDLAQSIQKDVLSCIHKYQFDALELTTAILESCMLWKGKRMSDEKSQKAAAAQQEANTKAALAQTNAEATRAQGAADITRAHVSEQSAEKIYSTGTVKHTLYAPSAPRENRSAANLNAAAQMLNAVADVGQAIAADVNVFQGMNNNFS